MKYIIRIGSLLFVLLAPLLTHADILGFMSNAFGVNNEIPTEIPPSNAQKMPLLQAPTNINPMEKKERLDVSVVDGSTLSTENGVSHANSNASGTSPIDPNRPASDQISLYTVHKGDTLQQIAAMFNVTPNTILWANDIKKGQSAVPGQVLVILPVTGVKYTVHKGDTLKSVAKKFKGDATDIARYNNLDDNASLTLGDELIIPDGEMSADVSLISGSGSKKSGKTYTNGRGGSLYDPVGYFMRPVIGGIRTQGIHGNNGVDLASSYGTPILAAASGTVVVSKGGGWNGGYGNYIVIQHANRTQTLYGHLSATKVQVGDQVSQGNVIGNMGSTGQSTGVHLHFEVRGGVNPF